MGMAASSETKRVDNKPPNPFSTFMQSVSTNFFSRFALNSNKTEPKSGSLCCDHHMNGIPSSSSGIPVLFTDLPVFTLSVPFNNPLAAVTSPASTQTSSSAIKTIPSGGFPSSSVRIDGLHSSSKGGPAFVGQVFSMCDPSGTGLMAVSTRIDIPFLSRAPEWIRRMLAMVTKNDKNGPIFRFFMDLGDAVAYVKQLHIPTGMVGACRLDVAYEHFKEKPHMFRFVPNKKQVKAANRLLKSISRDSAKRRLEGVPVFTAQNLSIAIAATDGIKWYTPYFFDKNLLDNILEASIDQHFHTLIQNRHVQRRRDVVDDNLAAEVVEENVESLFEPPEVQEALDEMGHSGIPLSIISKAAEIQILDVVDRVLLGNRWLRKATGIQPRLPYLVDSFEERSAASFLKSIESTSCVSNSEASVGHSGRELPIGALEVRSNERPKGGKAHGANQTGFHFPFGDWFSVLGSKPPAEQQTPDNPMKSTKSVADSHGECIKGTTMNPLLPKITMVGISTGEVGQMNRSSLKKTMEDLTKELEQTNQRSSQLSEDKDPLFVANVGDYSSITKASSA